MYIHSDISTNVPGTVSRLAISHPGWMKLSNALIKRMCVVSESGCGLACMDCQKLVTKIPGSTPDKVHIAWKNCLFEHRYIVRAKNSLKGSIL